MRRPLSIIDVVIGWRWFRKARLRRTIFGVAGLLLALFAVFPRAYVGDVKLAPQDSDTASLRAMVAQMGGNYAALLGQHEPVEIDLQIGRSYEVQSEVARRMGMVKGQGSADLAKAVEALQKRSDVRALRAGILEIEVKGHDPDQVVRMAGIYATVMQDRLSALSFREADFKQRILNERMSVARARLVGAQAAITAFRNTNGVVAPDVQMADAVASLSRLRSQYQTTKVELEKLRKFNTDASYAVKSVQAELAALSQQISTAQSRISTNAGLTAPGLGPKALEYEKLDQDLKFAQAVYDSYSRYFEGAAIERLTADYNMQIIEPPYLVLGWHFNTIPAALFIVLMLVALAAEFIFFRPPPGVPSAEE